MTRRTRKSRLLTVAPRTPEQLRAWLRLALGIEVPAEPASSRATPTGPLAYLWHAFHEPPEGKPDAVVWACRGGGKTFYAALATVLDLHFKPGIEVKVLGGSLEQSQRLHAHLRRFFERRPLAHLIDGRMTDRRVRLLNGSRAEVLAQSPTSVRGARPQKLRCDEAELFDRDVWAAAQLAPRSTLIRGTPVHASIEALSTCHEPFGLMSELIASAANPSSETQATRARRLFRWGAVDVLETCPPQRPCDRCSLWPECRARAKRGVGHLRIDDAVAMKSRVSASQWGAEMLCLRPRRDDCVLPEFDESIHVVETPPAGDRDQPAGPPDEPPAILAGMDFGFRAPCVFLWASHEPASNTLHVIDEHTESRLTIARHIERIGTRPWPRPRWIGIDPAGNAAEAQSGVSHASLLRAAGYTVRARPSHIEFGLGLLRARLDPAGAPPRLYIHPRCGRLIESLTRYHYPPASMTESVQPAKDGHDHAVDALRYLVLNLDAPGQTKLTNYL